MSAVAPIRDKQKIRDIINYLKKKSTRDALMFMLGIYTGLRISDILRLKVRDVRNKKVISIIEKKTKTKRSVMVHKELKAALESYTAELSDNDFLIKSREGYNQPITRTHAYRILQDVAETFCLSSIGTHTLRKTYGYHLYMENDKDIGLVQKALGHKHPSITLRYIGVEQEVVFNATMNLRYF